VTKPHSAEPETSSRAALSAGALEQVFERLPHGLAVVEPSRAIRAANAALRDLLGLAPGPTTCRAALACRPAAAGRPATGCGGACVVERALTPGEDVVDAPVLLPGGERALLSAVAVGDEGVMLEVVALRPARPRGEGGPAARIEVLGPVRVHTAAGFESGGWLDQRPGQLLRFLVASRGRSAPVDDIAEAIWPNAARTSVNTTRHLVHVLRGLLEPERPPGRASSCIVSVRGGYALDGARVVVDADEFAAAAGAALARLAAGDPGAPAALEAALARYGGDFLADEPYAEWARDERERLRAVAERLLRALADLAAARDDLGAATAYVERLALMEPFDSDVHRRLLALCLREGARGRAVRHYRAFADRLEHTLGTSPDFTLEDLMVDDGLSAPLADPARWAREDETRRAMG
jgi:DNA-binding SARP family transcriptional activator